jgi:hypothetical protein
LGRRVEQLHPDGDELQRGQAGLGREPFTANQIHPATPPTTIPQAPA